MVTELNVKDKTSKHTHTCVYICFIYVYMYTHSYLCDIKVLEDFYAIKICSQKSYIW